MIDARQHIIGKLIPFDDEAITVADSSIGLTASILSSNPRPKEAFKKGRIPWNKGKKGLQISWNKGKNFLWNIGRICRFLIWVTLLGIKVKKAGFLP